MPVEGRLPPTAGGAEGKRPDKDRLIPQDDPMMKTPPARKTRSFAPLVLLAAFMSATCTTSPATEEPVAAEVAAWEQRAAAVTIIRDDWGIPHVYGRTDADAVFGVIYAQAEDDFNRIETNYLNAMGRLAEAEGEAEIYRDLRMKLFIDPVDMQAKYASSPDWLKTTPEYDRRYPDGIPTSIVLNMADGTRYDSGLVMYPAGHARNTTANLDEILDAKFSMLAELAVPNPREIIDRFNRLPEMGADEMQSINDVEILDRGKFE